MLVVYGTVPVPYGTVGGNPLTVCTIIAQYVPYCAEQYVLVRTVFNSVYTGIKSRDIIVAVANSIYQYTGTSTGMIEYKKNWCDFLDVFRSWVKNHGGRSLVVPDHSLQYDNERVETWISHSMGLQWRGILCGWKRAA